MLSGFAAGTLQCVVTTPMELLKIRMQVYGKFVTRSFDLAMPDMATAISRRKLNIPPYGMWPSSIDLAVGRHLPSPLAKGKATIPRPKGNRVLAGDLFMCVVAQ